MYSKKERAAYNHGRDLKCKELGITVNQYNWLRRKGEELRRMYEDNCNGVFNTDAEYDDTVIPLQEKVLLYAKNLWNKGQKDVYIYFQTDPRGATVYADTKPIPENNYNRAHCIY